MVRKLSKSNKGCKDLERNYIIIPLTGEVAEETAKLILKELAV